LTGFNALVEAIHPVLGNIGVEIGLFWLEALDLDVVLAFRLVDQCQRLRKETAGLQCRDVDRKSVHADLGGDHLILDAEAGGEHRPPAETCRQ
jgi:hypothetical protein